MRNVLRRADRFVADIQQQVDLLRAETTEASRTPEQIEQDASASKRVQREGYRRGVRPWYARRAIPRTVPDSLKYYEDLHGTPATLALLRKLVSKREQGGH